jgi:hypothetical protein
MEDLRAALKSVPTDEVGLLPDAIASAVTQELVTKFVADQNATWWWTAPRQDVLVSIVPYTGDGLERLSWELSQWGAALVLATDEQAVPAGCLVGSARGLIRALKSLRHFEFAAISPSFERVLWDTHDNAHITWQAAH